MVNVYYNRLGNVLQIRIGGVQLSVRENAASVFKDLVSGSPTIGYDVVIHNSELMEEAIKAFTIYKLWEAGSRFSYPYLDEGEASRLATKELLNNEDPDYPLKEKARGFLRSSSNVELWDELRSHDWKPENIPSILAALE